MDYRLSHLNKGSDYDENLDQWNFDAFMSQRESKILQAILPKFFDGKIPRYLDFACGTGRITKVVEAMAKESYGVDVSQRMLEQARMKCKRTTFIQTDVTQEPLSIKPVNLVTAFRFFGNAEDELRLSALKQIHNMLDGNGYLVLNNHRNPWSIGNVAHRIQGHKSGQDLHYFKLKSMLMKSGFKILRAVGIGVWIFRDKLIQSEILNSRIGNTFEFISRIPLICPLCPDVVIIAQKIKRPTNNV